MIWIFSQQVLKWALRNGCQWDDMCISLALRNGHLEILKWLHKINCLPYKMDYLCAAASYQGAKKILKWAYKNNYYMIKDECIYWAKIDGHTKIIEWLEYNC
jgi:hypothetical protein